MTARFLLTLSLPFLLQTAGYAQSGLATHGMRTTASPGRVEQVRSSPMAQRGAAFGIPAASALTYTFPAGAKGPRHYLGVLRTVLPPFRYQRGPIVLPDRYEAFFFAESKVVRFSLQVKTHGDSLDQAWTKGLRNYFNYLDRDGDGYLNSSEAESIIPSAGLRELLVTNLAIPVFHESVQTFALMDRDLDGRISFDEFMAYYDPVMQDLVRLRHNAMDQDFYAVGLTDALFQLFDRDKDGKLSKKELQDLEALLPILDQNEDECLSSTELVPDLFTRTPPPRPVTPKPMSNELQSFRVYPVGKVPDAVLEQIYFRYNISKTLRISKDENPFDEGTFALLDTDKNQELSLSELLRWRDGPADLTLELVLGAAPAECSIRLLPNADGKTSIYAKELRITENGNARLQIGKQHVDIGAVAVMRQGNQQANNPLMLVYQQADPDNRGYVTEANLVGPSFQLFRILFDAMDRNQDGKVTKMEFETYVALQRSFTDLPLTIQHSARTPSLFQVLDTDGDGRLSVPELRAAWDRLKLLEPGPGEYITRNAIQSRGLLRFGRSSQIALAPSPVTSYNPRSVIANKGPVWFRKMDRNGDGVLSRSEFAGTPEEFNRLDTNHDDLIDLEEAEAIDKALRPANPKK